jgi:hypothetical protein
MNPYFARLAERGAGADVSVAGPARVAEPTALETMQDVPERASAPFEEVEGWSEAGPEPVAPALERRATQAVAADSAITHDAASQQAATTSATPASGLPRTEPTPMQTHAPSTQQTARAAEPRRPQPPPSPASHAAAPRPRVAPPPARATPAAAGADDYLETHAHAESVAVRAPDSSPAPAAVSVPDSSPAPVAAMRVLPVLAQAVPVPVRDAAPTASHAPLAATAQQDAATRIAGSPRTLEPAATARPRDATPLHIERRSDAPAQWQIHIGRIELEISAAPPAFAPNPAPAPAAPATAPPRPAFNPRRHYLRSG